LQCLWFAMFVCILAMLVLGLVWMLV
jgi:hypothetical protein